MNTDQTIQMKEGAAFTSDSLLSRWTPTGTFADNFRISGFMYGNLYAGNTKVLRETPLTS